MANKKKAQKATKTNSQPRSVGRNPTTSTRLTASVKVVTAEIDPNTLNACTDKIQHAIEEAVEAGVREGVGKVLAKLGITTELVVGKLSTTRQGSRKKQSAAQYASDKPKENGLVLVVGKGKMELATKGTAKNPTPHKASPRQRGTLEADALLVFESLKDNPKSRNEQIVSRTSLDARTVNQALRHLRGFNVRGEKTHEAVVVLPDGDRKRYTTYSVLDGAVFPPFAAPAKRGRAKQNTDVSANDAAPPASDMPAERIVESEEPSNG